MTTIKSKTLKVSNFSYLGAFFNLMKPRVMSLVIFTCAVGFLIAPIKINFIDAVFSLAAVALGSASVNFKAGSLDVGATGVTRKFNVTDSNNIVSEFNLSDSNKKSIWENSKKN